MRYIDRMVSFRGEIISVPCPWYGEIKQSYIFKSTEKQWGPVGKPYSGWFKKLSPGTNICSFWHGFIF